MDCLQKSNKFKDKQPVWTDPTDDVNSSTRGKDLEPKKIKKRRVEDSGDDDRSSSSSSDDDDDYDMYANDFRTNKYTLNNQNLNYKALVHLNSERSYQGAIKQIQFHPKFKMALLSLSRGSVDLYEVDGHNNRYIQTIKLRRTNGPYCCFTTDSLKNDLIVISSESYKGTFYTYNMASQQLSEQNLKVGPHFKYMTDFAIHGDYMACRKQGSQDVMLLSTKTYENAFSIRINEPVGCVKFHNDNEIFVASEDAKVYLWDIRKTSLCKHKFVDDGTVHIKSMDITHASNLLAIGSDCGIVNTYQLDDCIQQKAPKPLNVFDNLKTNIDTLRFNHTGELLIVGSSDQPGAFRLLHSHSGRVYRNFPKIGKNYGNLLCADFSPNSGNLALGCSTGRAPLFKLPYFGKY